MLCPYASWSSPLCMDNGARKTGFQHSTICEKPPVVSYMFLGCRLLYVIKKPTISNFKETTHMRHSTPWMNGISNASFWILCFFLKDLVLLILGNVFIRSTLHDTFPVPLLSVLVLPSHAKGKPWITLTINLCLSIN